MEHVLIKQEFLIICVEIAVMMILLVNLMKNVVKQVVVQNVSLHLLVCLLLQRKYKELILKFNSRGFSGDRGVQ
jgi:hypothetical protein